MTSDLPNGHRRRRSAIITLLSIIAAVLIVIAGILVFRPTSSSTTPTATSTKTPKPTPSMRPVPTATASPTPSTTPVAGATCTTASLHVTLGQPEGAAGSTIYPLVFTNDGSASCVLDGYPGVSMVTAENGAQIGASATHAGGQPAESQTIQPGSSVQALLKVAIAQNFAGCTPVSAAGLQVSPPGSSSAVFVAASQLTGCSQSTINVMSVQAVASS
jgi:hypothetical protein